VEFPYKAPVVALAATLALVAIAVYAARLSSHERLARIGLALVLGGAVGNLIDRLTLGSVVDFVDVVLGGWHFWAFNVADSAITLGVAAMLADMIGLDRHASSTV
jgi:signal peptidase II